MPRYLTPRRLDVALVVVLGIATIYYARTGWNTESSNGDAPFLIGPFPMPLPPFPPPPPSFSDTLPDMLENLAVVLMLLVRRRWPIQLFATQFGWLLALDVESNPASLLAVIIGAYSAVAFGRRLWLSMGTLLAACLLMVAVKQNTWPSLPDWSGVFVILLPVGLIGAAVRAGRERVRASAERSEASTRLAVAQERSRIARELHDVVSHHVSVMTIQAGAAGKVIDAQPGLAREALTAIESSGRETMAELRHLLGLLTPGPGDEMLHPQPGLEQLDQLIATVRQAGLPVTSRRTPVDLPRGLDLTAYRVVQEALTNALRYAPGAATDVAVRADGDGLVIEVVNDAPPPGTAVPAAAAGSGTGLLGLAERLKIYGGTLETGRRLGGGFRVTARLPLEATA
ncbi:sensor histidine kinase [Actinoplanes sp. NPDC051411]|uniref:sensor histidine kinase n=1 Tax=Actinoplanes sp. NPDC051411 TaxID=3155522 RepID=UPI00341FC5AD